MLVIFLPAFLAVERVFKTSRVSGITNLVTKLSPSLTDSLNPLYLLTSFKFLIKSIVPFVILPAFVLLAEIFAIRAPILTGDDKREPPPVIAVRANSSRAIEPIIPAVYPNCKPKLVKNCAEPPLVELPILVASANSLADSKSTADKYESSSNKSPKDL